MTRMNALWNCKNPYQGDYKKILCVCSAGLLRSPTIAYVLGEMGFNTRAAGIYDYALISVDDVLLDWADVIVTAEEEHKNHLTHIYDLSNKEIISLGRLFFSRTSCNKAAIIALLWLASLPPLRTHTLPLLKHKAAVSLVTLGRLS